MAQTASIIGLHFAGNGSVDKALALIERLAKAGRPMKAAVVVNDGGLCTAIKQRSPSTYVVFRGNVQGGGEGTPFEFLRPDGTGSVADPIQWCERMWAYNSQAPAADAYSLYNERTFGGNGQNEVYAKRVADFDLACMRWIDSAHPGKKIAGGNHYVGTHELKHVAAMGHLYDYAEAHDHPIIYHAYTQNTNDGSFFNDPHNFGMRWTWLWERWPRMKIVLGEVSVFNGPRFRGIEMMIRNMTELDDLCAPYVLQGRWVGGCWWTAAADNPNGEWFRDDITDGLDEWADYVEQRSVPVASKRRAPVGEIDVDDRVLPPSWFDATGFAKRYNIGTTAEAYHTGCDLNLNMPAWDSDAHRKVYAVMDGVVTANADYPVWGRIIVIDHGEVMCRYAHVENVQIKAGDAVVKGQWIANIGNGNGQQPYHLHFDVSHTRKLKSKPDYWPKLDWNGLIANFVDPVPYMATGELPKVPLIIDIKVRTDGGAKLNVRASASTSAAVIAQLKNGDVVRASEYNANWYRLADRDGYVHRCCVEPYIPPVIRNVWVNAKPWLNIRAQPTATSADLGDLAYGEAVAVAESPAIGWWQLTERTGYISKEYTQDTPISPTWKMPIAASTRGVHASAGGWAPTAGALDKARRSNVKWAFIAAYRDDQAHGVALFKDAGVQQFVVRACTNAPAGRPSDFVANTVAALRSYAARLPSDFMLAIHNEPNLKQEGATVSWANGTEFASWWIAVRDAFRKEFPDAKFGFPALSPGGAVANVRLDEALFISQARAAIVEADWIGVHYYWLREDGTDIAPPFDKWKLWFGSKPLMGTEIGPADGVQGNGLAYQRAYSRFAAGGVPMAAWLLQGAGSWQNADWEAKGIVVPA